MALFGSVRRTFSGAWPRWVGRTFTPGITLAVGIGLLCAACTTTPSAAPSTAAAVGAPTRVTVRGDFILAAYHAPYFVAMDKGWYAAEGLEVEFNEGQGSGNTVQLVAADKDTFGFATADAVINGVAQDAPVKMIANIFPTSGVCVMVRADSDIKTPKDLEGHSYAVAASGPPNTLFPAYLQAAGADISKVKIVTVDASSVLTGFVNKQFDTSGVISYGEPIEAKLRFGIENRCLLFSDAGVNTMGHGLITNTQTIKDRPAQVRGFVRATLKGFEYTFANPEESVAIMKRRASNTSKLADDATLVAKLVAMHSLTSVKETQGKPLGTMTDGLWQQSIEIIQKFGDLKNPPTPALLYTNEFLQ